MKKVLIFSTHPIQYHAPIWRGLNELDGFDVRVIYGTDMSVRGYRDPEFCVDVKWDQPLLEGTRGAVLSVESEMSFFKPRAPSRAIRDALGNFRPDVVMITAYSKLFWVDVLRWVFSEQIPLVIRSEASDVAGLRSPFKSWLRDRILGFLYRRTAAFAVIGSEARKHYNRLNVSEKLQFSSPYCVDSELFERQFEQLRDSRDQFRADMHIEPDGMVLIFSGKLVERKDPMIILSAIARLEVSVLAKIHLVVAGDGPLRAEFVHVAENLLGHRFHYLGFMNQMEISKAYIIADLLVLPSRPGWHETWGLVVNEAMQFGCCAIVSQSVGCHSDLIDSDTGTVFTSGDVEELAAQVTRFVGLPLVERARMAQAARSKISAYTAARAVDGVRRAVHCAARKPHSRDLGN